MLLDGFVRSIARTVPSSTTQHARRWTLIYRLITLPSNLLSPFSYSIGPITFNLFQQKQEQLPSFCMWLRMWVEDRCLKRMLVTIIFNDIKTSNMNFAKRTNHTLKNRTCSARSSIEAKPYSKQIFPTKLKLALESNMTAPKSAPVAPTSKSPHFL